MLVPGLLALVFGFLAFRSRVTGVYLSIITQALTYALMLAFFRNDMGFGGNNGFTDFKDILGFDLQRAGHAAWRCFYYGGRAGRALPGVPLHRRLARRPGDRRRCATPRVARASSAFASSRTSCGCSCFSAVLAGIAGALYVPQVGIINPGEFPPVNSIEVVIWVAIGGRGTLYGAVVGALLVNYAKTYFTGGVARTVAVRARRDVRAGDTVPAHGVIGLPRSSAAAPRTPAPVRHEIRGQPMIRAVLQRSRGRSRSAKPPRVGGDARRAIRSTAGPMPRTASFCISRTSPSASMASRRSTI